MAYGQSENGSRQPGGESYRLAAMAIQSKTYGLPGGDVWEETWQWFLAAG